MTYYDGSNGNISGTADADVVDFTGTLSTTFYSVDLGDGNNSVFLGNDYLSSSTVIGYFTAGSGIDSIYTVGAYQINMDLSSGTFYGSGSMWTSLISGFENVYGSSGVDYITGDANNNLINGGDGGDHLAAGGGIDTLDYRDSDAGVAINLATMTASGGHADGDSFTGFERVWGSAFDDTLTGDSGRNQLVGYAGADFLDGGASTDMLRGMDGQDTLAGGAGGDKLYGGADDDTFVYASASDSRVWTQRDTIADFQSGDVIDLAAIDTDGVTSGDQAFHFRGTAYFDGEAGALRYGVTSSGVTVLGDVDGDRHADFAIELANVTELHAEDFIL